MYNEHCVCTQLYFLLSRSEVCVQCIQCYKAVFSNSLFDWGTPKKHCCKRRCYIYRNCEYTLKQKNKCFLSLEAVTWPSAALRDQLSLGSLWTASWTALPVPSGYSSEKEKATGLFQPLCRETSYQTCYNWPVKRTVTLRTGVLSFLFPLLPLFLLLKSSIKNSLNKF